MTEAEIRDSIFRYLIACGVFAWRDRQSPKLIRIGTRRDQRGVADILGIYNGKFLAIEVKTKEGKLSKEQAEWGKRVLKEGGIYAVVRSLEDVREALRYFS